MQRTSSVWRLGAIVLAFVCAGAHAHAQGLGLDSDPDTLARAALGEERGVVAVGVWRDGQARYGLAAQGGSAATAGADKTLFEIGSISKVFTGLLVAQAVERNELKLDDRLGDLLQGKVEFASPAVASITLRQLLTHSACLPRLAESPRNSRDNGAQYREFDRARVWSSLGRLQIDQSPPCRPSYSNFGFAILGELLADRAGKPWHALVHEQITAPLGMHDTKVALGDDAPRLVSGFNGWSSTEWWEMKAYAGAGGLRSTAADMLRFSQAVFAGSKGPLGPAVDRLLTPLGPYQGGQVGYGVMMRGPKDKRTFGHSGLTGGFQALWRLNGDTGEALIVLASNAQARTGWLDTVIAASRYPVGAERIAIDAAALPQYNGVFRVAKELAFIFVAQDGVLYGRATGQAFQPLQPNADDTFVQPEIGARFTFQRSGERITAVRLDQGGSVVTASRTDEPVPRRATLPASALQPYIGRYRFARDWEFIARAEQGQLFVKSGNRVRQIVFPIDDGRDRFAYDIVDAQLEFERGLNGEVGAVVLHEREKRRAVRLND